MSLLELADLSAGYGTFQALFGISLRIEEGQTFAVIGANGAGKSTLLRAVSGLITTPEEKVRFEGRPVGGLSAHKRVGLGISMVPEGRQVFPSLTVHENLLVGAHAKRPGPWNTDKVYELFPLLARLRDRQASGLSGGEQQAMVIGRGLMANPRLLLLDEVSLGLAPIVVQQLYQAMPAIVESGITIMLVEQDIGQAAAVADHVTCLLEGRVALAGRPADLTREQITVAYFGG